METAQQYEARKRRELIERKARQRAQDGNLGETRVGANGETELIPSLRDRLDLTGPGAVIGGLLNTLGFKNHPYSADVDFDVRNEMAEIKAVGEKMLDVQEAEKYVKLLKDEYPELGEYDTAGGKAGAVEIKKKADIRQKNEDLLARYGETWASVGLEDGKHYDYAVVAAKIRERQEQKEADLRKPELLLAKRAADNADRTTQITANTAANNAIHNNNLLKLQQLQGERADIRAENEAAQRAFEAAEERRYRESRDQMTFKLGMLDREDRREEREMRREEARNELRQLQIMKLLESLTNLGNFL